MKPLEILSRKLLSAVINKIDEKIESLKPEIEKDLANLISIRSVKGEKTENAPFGKDIRKVLDVGLEIGRHLGFITKDLDGYAGILEMGESQEYIGIFGHLDVVPEGNGWSTPPYLLTKKDGKFFGRGVLDNKGPLLATIYATKILKDLQVNFPKKIRIVLGTDEESGMNDIPYYLSKELPAIMGFTPDCKFPVVYGENGILRLKISYPLTKNKNYFLKKIEGDYSKAFIPDYTKIIFDKFGEEISIEGKGVKAPSNNPYLATNSLILALNSLSLEVLENLDCGEAFQELIKLFSSVYGENLGIKYKNSETGEVLVSFYELKKIEDSLEVSISVRYPVDCTEEFILENLQKNISGKIEVEYRMPSIVKDKNSPLVEKLSQGYFEVTGLNSKPVTTTGGTYARKVPNIVAFGPSFPNEKGIAHNKDEYIVEENFYQLIKIYAMAIYRLFEII